MSVYAYLIFKKKSPELNSKPELREIAAAVRLLDKVCIAKKVKPFSNFCSPSDEELELPPRSGKYREPWYSCADGTRILKAVIEALKNEQQWLKVGRMTNKRELRDLVIELEELGRCLEVGRQQRTTFYLAIA